MVGEPVPSVTVVVVGCRRLRDKQRWGGPDLAPPGMNGSMPSQGMSSCASRGQRTGCRGVARGADGCIHLHVSWRRAERPVATTASY